MKIKIYRSLDVSTFPPDVVDITRRKNESLRRDQHAPDCPVRAGASFNCVWPFAVCKYDEHEIYACEVVQ